MSQEAITAEFCMADAVFGPSPLAAIVPLHLRGADRIAQHFGVKRQTVIQWAHNGAPLALVGKTYMAEYSTLMAWLVARSRDGTPL